MDTYSLLRHFADSWFLLLMTAFFLGCVLWAFRPGSRAIHDDAARTPFRGDAAPTPPGERADRAPSPDERPDARRGGAGAPHLAGCANARPSCACRGPAAPGGTPR